MKDGHGIRQAAETIYRMFHGAENNNCILRIVIFTTAGYHTRQKMEEQNVVFFF